MEAKIVKMQIRSNYRRLPWPLDLTQQDNSKER
jgi:hypothetical protein